MLLDEVEIKANTVDIDDSDIPLNKLLAIAPQGATGFDTVWLLMITFTLSNGLQLLLTDVLRLPCSCVGSSERTYRLWFCLREDMLVER